MTKYTLQAVVQFTINDDTIQEAADDAICLIHSWIRKGYIDKCTRMKIMHYEEQEVEISEE